MILFFILFDFLIFQVHSSAAIVLDGCISSKGEPIEHFDYPARAGGLKKRILVISQIHGDEHQSGDLSRLWVNRLNAIKNPSNHWRIIPALNPDGIVNKTRYNANKVDLNRNFPTKDWNDFALEHWTQVQKSHPRRYPGQSAGSEKETICAINQINDFKPDLVVAIHTPYGLFDFDGPTDKKIKTNLLPWRRLGTFPGSLGRYLWDERGIPTLTIELRPNSVKNGERGFIHFQDLLSDLLLK